MKRFSACGVTQVYSVFQIALLIIDIPVKKEGNSEETTHLRNGTESQVCLFLTNFTYTDDVVNHIQIIA